MHSHATRRGTFDWRRLWPRFLLEFFRYSYFSSSARLMWGRRLRPARVSPNSARPVAPQMPADTPGRSAPPTTALPSFPNAAAGRKALASAVIKPAISRCRSVTKFPRTTSHCRFHEGVWQTLPGGTPGNTESRFARPVRTASPFAVSPGTSRFFLRAFATQVMRTGDACLADRAPLNILHWRTQCSAGTDVTRDWRGLGLAHLRHRR